jgi:hypothetical protein
MGLRCSQQILRCSTLVEGIKKSIPRLQVFCYCVVRVAFLARVVVALLCEIEFNKPTFKVTFDCCFPIVEVIHYWYEGFCLDDYWWTYTAVADALYCFYSLV